MKHLNLLKLRPIQKFIEGVGQQIKEYFGKDKGCIIGLEDDGVFYGQGLYLWLTSQNKKITFCSMDHSGNGLEKEKVRKRKVLIVDNDIVTGNAYRKAMDFLRGLKNELEIKDIKFAALCDRTNLADFSVEGYVASLKGEEIKIDKTDLKIIQALAEDGRKTLVEIAKETGLTGVGAKKRVERLLKNNVLEIKGLLNIEKFYSVSANIGIEADKETCQKLIKKLEKAPFVYNLLRVSGTHKSLIVDIVAPNLKTIDEFIEKQIKSEPGVRYVEVNIGTLPIVPKGINKTTF